MTILSNLSIDLTDFTGRILIVSDLYGHFELLLKGLSKLTQSGDEVVVITTGNLFDWGPSPCHLLEAVVGFVNGMVASHLLCHSGTINRHSLNGALLS
ncbi:TrhO [Klebsiella pneumoniae]|uniref:hypothetical protein n=1 Tax=Klebsiella pneumoniae TaxID=573 RepID=UPI0010D5048C|nr:hypothetical protein [Klebsiella pneumoniae]VGA92397.1 TrhO [Klebsiella pneumoniae]